MSTKKIVILGASGFVGTTLAERMHGVGGVQVVPVIHSASGAWRLARRAHPLAQVDVLDPQAVAAVIRGASHVVNCTRGARDVMIDGLRNILKACRAEGVRRFVHLSSVMVYGDPPHPDSYHETAPTRPLPGSESYSMMKFEQDQMVRAAARGVPSVILCPPNITGPFSGYLVGIVSGLRNRSFAQVGDGMGPCNLVDVRNLCRAIELALDAADEAADGERMFIADGEPITWRDVTDALQGLADTRDIRTITNDELKSLLGRGSQERPASIGASLRHLVSSDVRAALRKDPLLARLDRAARASVAKLGRGMENRLRVGIEGPLSVSRPDPHAGLALGLCAQQLREVRHLNDKAARVLGYEPPVSFAQSMADFRAWYRRMHGMDGDLWTVSRHLYGT